MLPHLPLVVLLLLFINPAPCFSTPIRSSDRAVLSDLYDLYGGINWPESVREDWIGLKGDTLVDPCESFGSVGCDGSGAVTLIDMSWFELSYSGPEGDGQSELEPICGLESLEVRERGCEGQRQANSR
jgi:hypothetical protein